MRNYPDKFPNHYKKLEELIWIYDQDMPIPDGIKHTRMPFEQVMQEQIDFEDNCYGTEIVAVKNNQYIVIGSGPSGVSCATALLKKKNVKVLMLDTGYELEKDLELEAKKLYKIDYKKWPKKTFNTKPDLYYKGVPLKKLYGSNFLKLAEISLKEPEDANYIPFLKEKLPSDWINRFNENLAYFTESKNNSNKKMTL